MHRREVQPGERLGVHVVRPRALSGRRGVHGVQAMRGGEESGQQGQGGLRQVSGNQQGLCRGY